LTPLDGVREAIVDIPHREVRVSYDEAVVTRHAIVEAIEDQGYEVPTIT
jgi:copper chaperone CopZ